MVGIPKTGYGTNGSVGEKTLNWAKALCWLLEQGILEIENSAFTDHVPKQTLVGYAAVSGLFWSPVPFL